jgi:hypothetical protein
MNDIAKKQCRLMKKYFLRKIIAKIYTSLIKMKISKNIGILCCCFIITSSCNLNGNKENTRVKKRSEDSDIVNKTNPPQLDTARIDMDKVKQELDWSDVRLKFLSECLNPFLEAKKVTTNCSDCDKISFSYILTTNEKGAVIKVKRESELIQCKQLTSNDIAELHAVIESYFKKQILPGSFAKGSYTGQLGFIVKC